jgi:hypothetical protein
MSELSESITERLAAMPQAQQVYFADAIERGKSNIFETISELKKPEGVPVEYRAAGGLALAQLNEMLNGVATPRAKSELDALEHVNAEIDAARAAGDTERANMLQGAIRKVAAAAITDEEREAHELIGATVVSELTDGRQAQFDAAYEEASDLALRALKRQMADDDAEAFFKQYDEPKIKLALERAYGV